MRLLASIAFIAAALSLAPAGRAATLFTSGPANGEVSAWDISAYAQYNSFLGVGGQTVTGADFTVWVLNGVTMTNVDWAILTSPTGSTLASGSGAVVSQTFLSTDPNYASSSYGYDIDSESFAIPAWLIPSDGTYWLELTNGVTNGIGGGAQYAYWDENDNPNVSAYTSYGGGAYVTNGVDGCGFASCSETFDITGTVPEPGTLPLLAFGMLGVAFLNRRRLAAFRSGSR